VSGPRRSRTISWRSGGAEGRRDFTEAQDELAAWVAARSWTSGDGPKAIFLDAIGWVRERKILLPGVSRPARLVAQAVG
jgi:hypothetical protein